MGTATLSLVNPGSRLGLIAESCGLGRSGVRMMLRAYDLCVCRDFSDSSVRETPALVAGLHYLVLSGQAVKILYVRTSTNSSYVAGCSLKSEKVTKQLLIPSR